MVSVLLSRLQCQNLDVRHINTPNCKILCVASSQNMIIHRSFVFSYYDGEHNGAGNSLLNLLFVTGICCCSHVFVMSG